MMKIDCSRQVLAEQTDGRTNELRLAFLELLSEPKRVKVAKAEPELDNNIATSGQGFCESNPWRLKCNATLVMNEAE